MKEYRVMASVYDDLLTPAEVRRILLKEFGHNSSIYTIKCDSVQEIPDLFLDAHGEECIYMRDQIHWYVETEKGWQLLDFS